MALNRENACRISPAQSVSKVELVLSVTSFAIYRVACVQLAHSIIAIIISCRLSEIWSMHRFHCCHIIPWLCVWGGYAIITSLSKCIYIYIFDYWYAVYGVCNDRVHFGMWAAFVCLHITLSHYYHYADFSISMNFLNACGAYAFEWWSWVCVLHLIIIIKSKLWIINHCLGLGLTMS